jgi:hypothetical protein
VLRHRCTLGLVRLPDLDAKSPSALAPPLRTPSARPLPVLRHASRDQRDSADKIEPALAAEPTEIMEANEATEPIERIDPAEPMDKIEPVEPMDKMDPLDPILSSEPAEPADRSELFMFPIPRFSHSGQEESTSWLRQPAPPPVLEKRFLLRTGSGFTHHRPCAVPPGRKPVGLVVRPKAETALDQEVLRVLGLPQPRVYPFSFGQQSSQANTQDAV